MTRETVLYRVCDRPHPQDVEAATTDKFSLNGYRYEIDLCSDCSHELYGQLMGWADSGTCVGEPTLFDRPKAARATTVVMAPPLEVEEPPAQAAPEQRQERRGPHRKTLPATASRWRLSKHAEEQRVERQFTLEEVLWACERPEVVTPEFDERGGETRKRGRCLAVVEPHEHVVITVKIVGETKQSWRESLASAEQQQKGA